jgi:hypothetical protein
MQADNYPFKPAEASQVNHYRTLPDLLIRAPAGSAHDIAMRASTAYAGAISSVQYRFDAIVVCARSTPRPYVFRMLLAVRVVG